VKLEYRPVVRAGITWGYHTDIVVTDQYGFTTTMEGTHDHATGNLGVQNDPGDIHDKQWGKTLTSQMVSDLCDRINDMFSAEMNYSNNEVKYFALGPNSNSLAHWLLQAGFISQYFTAPPGTTGWNTPVYGNLFP
jgi:hypothetical protein